MKSVPFFNGYIEPYGYTEPTQQYKKIAKKEKKWENKKQTIRHKHLTEAEKKKVMHIVTLSSHYLEGFIDCLDELENLQVLGKENDMLRVREKLLKAQEFFIKEALNQGEDTYMMRQQQQKRMESLIKSIMELNISKFDDLLNYAENLKFKK